MNYIGKGIGTIGIWMAIAYLGKNIPTSCILSLPCAMIATLQIWDN